jgi:lipopolysaccharide transport system ATP-binding protein
MTGGLALKVDGLGKRYELGMARSAFGSINALRTGTERELFWALRDVSFEVARGEAVGIIGSNGAGKTTLLKILSRITNPTAGEAALYGKLGSLLEVGTGFHPELTGRENVYFNGSILGMRKREIDRKFDEIVAFADIGDFIDTPVKRYSTGMAVRLAFAVPAHLDTDILLVDEILSVGDFRFQQRSLGKMQEQTQGEGRTVLFVSHNLGSVKTLTSRCVWLDHGVIRSIGPTDEVIRDYIASYEDESADGEVDLSNPQFRRPKSKYTQQVRFERIRLENAHGAATNVLLERDPLQIKLRLRSVVAQPGVRMEVRCALTTVDGLVVFTASSGPQELDLEEGVYETSFRIDPNDIVAGTYSLEPHVRLIGSDVSSTMQDRVRNALTFRVEHNPEQENGVQVADWGNLAAQDGLVRVHFPWEPIVHTGERTPAV